MHATMGPSTFPGEKRRSGRRASRAGPPGPGGIPGDSWGLEAGGLLLTDRAGLSYFNCHSAVH